MSAGKNGHFLTVKYLVLLYLTVTISSVTPAFADPTYFDECANETAGFTTIPFKGSFQKHSFVRKCAPDTLYSWQSEFDPALFEKDPLLGRGYLYTWRTPLGTFGYGENQIRIKLRKNVQFKWVDWNDRDCRQKDSKESINTVYVAYLAPFRASEYLLCSDGPVESWSTGTLGAYLEAVNELEHVKGHQSGSESQQKYDSYGWCKNRRRCAEDSYDQNPYFLNIRDPDVSWDLKSLELNLEKMKRKSAEENVVHFSLDRRPRPKGHFRTNVNSYFRLEVGQMNEVLKTVHVQP